MILNWIETRGKTQINGLLLDGLNENKRTTFDGLDKIVLVLVDFTYLS